MVICAGGGGVPTMFEPGTTERTLVGVEAVIDKDLASELLARELGADLFVMATDVDGVYADWGTPAQRRLATVTPAELRASTSPPARWAPRSRRPIRFVEQTGKRAAIGALADIEGIVAGTAARTSCRAAETTQETKTTTRREHWPWMNSASTQRWASSAR